MSALLLIFSLIAFIAGAALSDPSNPQDDITGAALLVASAVFFTGAAIVNAVNKVRKQLEFINEDSASDQDDILGPDKDPSSTGYFP